MSDSISGIIKGVKLDEMNKYLKVISEKIKQGTFNIKIYIQKLIYDFLQIQKIIIYIQDLMKKNMNLKFL